MTISEDETKLVCLICGQNCLRLKRTNARKHMIRAHKDSVDSMTLDAKKKLKEKYLSDVKTGQYQVQQFLGPHDLIKTSPYKLAYTIAKHKMHFSSCGAFIEFAKAAYPDSVVFQKMASSRQTITRRSVDIHRR